MNAAPAGQTATLFGVCDGITGLPKTPVTEKKEKKRRRKRVYVVRAIDHAKSGSSTCRNGDKRRRESLAFFKFHIPFLRDAHELSTRTTCVAQSRV